MLVQPARARWDCLPLPKPARDQDARHFRGRSRGSLGHIWHDVSPGLSALLALPAINGTEPYPQFDFWAQLDPKGRYFQEYNRYAHVWFTAAENGIEIKSTYLDQVRVSLAPTDPILDHFDVRFFLVVSPEDQFFDRLPQLAKVFDWGRMHIYRKRGAASP